MIKKIFVFFSLIILVLIPSYIIYLEDVRYSLPTPIPFNYEEVKIHSKIIPPHPFLAVNNKPLHIHFFNPHCPCSRFNMEHFRDLVKKFSDQVDFVIVLQKENQNSLEKFKKMNLDLPFVEDKNGSIALSYGVYSTPQAIILDKEGKLFYRGNYNQSRFCALKSSEYARIALESILREEKLKDLPMYAKIAYGCELPTDLLKSKRNELLDNLFLKN